MLIQLKGGGVYDPVNQMDGEIRDLFIRDSRLVAAPEVGESVDFTHDLDGHFVMAGAMDVHTHIGGGKLNIARMLLPELLANGMGPYSHLEHRGFALRDPLLRSQRDSFLPTAPMTGKRYLEMGYTAAFEPAMMACNARATHAELADVTSIDSGAYVLLGNDDCLLQMIRDDAPQSLINAYVALAVNATQALGVKVVNAGGIHAFKYNTRKLDVDTPHPELGITPAQIIRRLARAVDEIGLPQPLHVHASNLGAPGNIRSTLKTIAAADGHRIHLTHVQFHSYGDEGPKGFSSAASQIADALQQNPHVTIDVGQVMFGQTVTMSADTMHQFHSSRFADPRKSILLDVECEAGCGVVPFRYRDRSYINALQWAIGLELFLLVDDPSRVFLTTDHPNGGPFTTYPHLLRLLMDSRFRDDALREIHPDAAASSELSGLQREYSLRDVAMMTRAAPAKFLGLRDLGHLGPGAIADIAVYRRPKTSNSADWQAVFEKPSHVFRRGRLVVRDGAMIDVAEKCNHYVRPLWDEALDAEVNARMRQSGQIPWEELTISEDEMASLIGVPSQAHPNLRAQRS